MNLDVLEVIALLFPEPSRAREGSVQSVLARTVEAEGAEAARPHCPVRQCNDSTGDERSHDDRAKGDVDGLRGRIYSAPPTRTACRPPSGVVQLSSYSPPPMPDDSSTERSPVQLV
jgi:hypothetical protein